MRLPERTRLAFIAVPLLTTARYKSKTPVPEFSITGYLIKAHIRQHKSRPWLGPAVPLTLPALDRILVALCIRKLPALALRRRGLDLWYW